MTASSSGKICVHCGEDCSTRPRVKDSHDNYYCKTCHEKVEKNQRQRETVSLSPDPQEILAPAAADSGADIPMVNTEHAHDHGDLLDETDVSKMPDDSGSSEFDAVMSEVEIEVEPEEGDHDDLILLEDDDD